MIRRFNTTDRDKFVAFSNKLYEGDAVLFKTGEDNFHKTFDLVLENGPYADGYIIEKDGIIAGYGLLTFSYSSEMGGMIAWIEELFIDEKYRGSGLGSEFLEFIEKEFRGKCAYIRLEVVEENGRALNLYTRKGYNVLGYMQLLKKL